MSEQLQRSPLGDRLAALPARVFPARAPAAGLGPLMADFSAGGGALGAGV